MIDTENKSRTELGELGEFTLIEHLTNDFEIKNPSNVSPATIAMLGNSIFVQQHFLFSQLSIIRYF